MSVLRVILGDQLSHDIAALRDVDKAQDVILLCEVWDEAAYVKHHKKKIAFIFSAMRHFAQELREKGYQVDYIILDAEGNSGSFTGEVSRALTRHTIETICVTEPSEHRVLEQVKTWGDQFGIYTRIMPDDRFLCSHAQFRDWAKDRKSLRMEYFYRMMRKAHNVLMEGDDPVGGQWNYDSENRKPPKDGLDVPDAYNSRTDEITEEVVALVEERFADHFGDVQPFYFAVTRAQALYVLRKFIDERLPQFGDYQDAMVQGEPWMYHSHISFYINCGLLNPLECVRAAQTAYHDGTAPLNAVEGFIRQILGWREFIRGVYWLYMPDYADANYLDATRPLPALYWGAQTKMNCMKQCVDETKRHAYAHHIQRLMVTGNFALLAGLSVEEVNEWYLIVYADAYEWVEMPNVTGMILFADKGKVASKPYAAGGAYINRMSDYCKSCSYKVTKKNGEDACPFNYLYWDFLVRHRDKFQNNPRIAMMYRSWDKMSDEKQQATRDDASRFLRALDIGECV